MSIKITYRARGVTEDERAATRAVWITDSESDFFLILVFLQYDEAKVEMTRFRALGTTRAEVFFLGDDFDAIGNGKALELGRKSDADISVFLLHLNRGHTVCVFSKKHDDIIAEVNESGVVDIYRRPDSPAWPVDSIYLKTEGLKKPEKEVTDNA
jgi:hypothetical protein